MRSKPNAKRNPTKAVHLHRRPLHSQAQDRLCRGAEIVPSCSLDSARDERFAFFFQTADAFGFNAHDCSKKCDVSTAELVSDAGSFDIRSAW